jgi:cell division protein FtsB
MFDGFYRFLGLNVNHKKTSFKSIRNSLLLVVGLAAAVISPTFLVYVDQANQLKQMEANIALSFDKVDDLKNEINSIQDKTYILEQAQERLKMVSSTGEITGEPANVASETAGTGEESPVE